MFNNNRKKDLKMSCKLKVNRSSGQYSIAVEESFLKKQGIQLEFNDLLNENIETLAPRRKSVFRSNSKNSFKLITLQGKTQGGVSKKVRNLKWKDFLNAILLSTIDSFTIIETKCLPEDFLKALIAIGLGVKVITDVNDAMKIEISEEDGLLLWIIHTFNTSIGRGTRIPCDIDNIENVYGEYQQVCNLRGYTKEEIVSKLKSLEEIGCIERKNGEWVTKEKIVIKDQ